MSNNAYITVDPGWRNLAVAIIYKEEKVYSGVWDLTYGTSFKVFKEIVNWRELIVNHLKRYFNNLEQRYEKEPWMYAVWSLLIEKQMKDDLIWLTGVITGFVSSRPFQTEICPMYRSCDACKAFGIPANKNIITRADKKKRTQELISKAGFEIETDHEADAILLYKYHHKRQKTKK